MNNLQAFAYEGKKKVRTVEINDEVWFVLKDVCGILEIGSPHKVAERLDEDEKGWSSIPTPGGEQKVAIINESGLYSLVIRSDKPKAKKFRKWVTSEVLPSLRKTGSYSLAPSVKSRDVVFEEHMRMAKTLSETTKIELFDSVESAIEATEQETGSNLEHFKKLIDKHSPNGWKKIFRKE